MTMQRGFKKELAAVSPVNIRACKKEIFHALGLKSVTQFYRKRNGETKLNPAEVAAVKEIIDKYKQ